jgi:hypothetical protein
MFMQKWRVLFFVALLVHIAFLSACSIDETYRSTEGSSQSYQYQDGLLISIESDNVSAAGYKKSTRTLTIVFDSGSIYEYYDVSESVWIDFLEAQPHPWSRVGYPQLVQGGVSYSKIG